ncbi:MAG: phosphatase PAP2 family protein [Candidatus Saccharibacteria bacterium]
MLTDTSEKPKIKKIIPTKTSIRIAIISFAVGVIIFTLAYIDMRQKTGLGSLNQPILMWMVNHRNPLAIDIAKTVTTIAGPLVFIAITAIIVSIWILVKREIWRPCLLAGSMGLAVTTSTILKTIIMDNRPSLEFMIPTFEVDYSFPSGHTIGMMVFLLVIGYLIYSRNYSPKRFWIWIITAVIGAEIIAASRLYLGYHWLTDVVASIGLGFIILAIVVVTDKLVTRRFKQLK